MNCNIKLRVDTSDDLQIQHFLKNNLPYTFQEKGFYWQYNRIDSIFCYVTDDKNKIIGVNGIIPYYLSSNNIKIKSAKNETGYIHSSFQGKGVFKKLYNELLSNTFSSSFQIIWGFTKLGNIWTKLGSKVYSNFLCDAFLVINPSIKKQKYKFSSDSSIKSLLRFIYNLYVFKYKFKLDDFTEKGYTIQFGLPHFQVLKAFYSKLKLIDEKLVFLEVDEFIKTYFLDSNPYQLYNYLSFFDINDELIGFLIYTKTFQSVNVVELQFLKPEDVETILNIFLSEKEIFENVYDLTFFGNAKNNRIELIFDILKKKGAKLVVSEMDIVVKENQTFTNKEFLNVKNWYINLLWTECVKR